jgi:hypothetical protein
MVQVRYIIIETKEYACIGYYGLSQFVCIFALSQLYAYLLVYNFFIKHHLWMPAQSSRFTSPLNTGTEQIMHTLIDNSQTITHC